jgi:hypothetical protein
VISPYAAQRQTFPTTIRKPPTPLPCRAVGVN